MALVLTEQDVLQVLTIRMALEAVEAAQRALAEGGATNHPRRRHRTDKGLLHVMDAALPSLGVMGLKSYTTFKGDLNRFHVLLYSSEDGGLEAIVAADHLGRFRTGAASGVATRHLARADARVLALIGAGRQAMTQVQAICEVRPIEQVRVFCRSRDRRESFVRDAASKVKAEMAPVESAQAAIEGADVVVTATTSREPVLEGAWLREGAHVNAMGANSILRCEIDRKTVTRAGLVAVDSLDQARVESACLVDAVQSRLLDWSNFVELGEILAGKAPGRAAPAQITLFVSHGIAAWDVALAKRVLDEARARGLGAPAAV
jgi:alanine dehydrogenase